MRLLNQAAKSPQWFDDVHLKEFARREHYDLDMYTLRYGLEVDRLEEWKKHGVTHTVFYNAVLRNGGTGQVIVHDAPLLRKLGNFAQIYLFRALHRFCV